MIDIKQLLPSDYFRAILAGNAPTALNPFVTSNDVRLKASIQLACSDETTALTTGVGKITFRMPYAFTLTGVRASLTTAQASGNIFTVDINEGGVSILSTKSIILFLFRHMQMHQEYLLVLLRYMIIVLLVL